MVLFNNKNVVRTVFPNGEFGFEDLKSCLKRNNTITIIFENNEDIFSLIMLKKWYDDSFNSYVQKDCTLVMEFCPYGQMDRKIENFMFSFKYFAQIINDLKFDEVIITDPHSIVMSACLDKVLVCNPTIQIESLIRDGDYDYLCYPDEGAAKKYSELFNYQYIYGRKKRNLQTGEIISYEIETNGADLTNKKVLIVDDIVMGGRTFKEAAKKLQEFHTYQIGLFITHVQSSAKDFYLNHKDYHIDNFYTINTLKMPFIKPESII